MCYLSINALFYILQLATASAFTQGTVSTHTQQCLSTGTTVQLYNEQQVL